MQTFQFQTSNCHSRNLSQGGSRKAVVSHTVKELACQFTVLMMHHMLTHIAWVCYQRVIKGLAYYWKAVRAHFWFGRIRAHCSVACGGSLEDRARRLRRKSNGQSGAGRVARCFWLGLQTAISGHLFFLHVMASSHSWMPLSQLPLPCSSHSQCFFSSAAQWKNLPHPWSTKCRRSRSLCYLKCRQ